MTPMEYTIIATLGPSSQTESSWREMLAAGVSGFRLNTSHLSLPQLHHWLGRLADFLSGIDPQPALILDLQGSKWRLGDFNARALQPGQTLEFIFATVSETPDVIPVPHPDFFQAAALSNGKILLNDAKVHMALETTGPDWLRARVTKGGEIAPNKGITFAFSKYRQESLSQKDQTILEKTRGFPSIRYAISYVKDSAEMASYRSLLGGSTYLAAKLERPAAVEEALQVAESANELWLCRGDLGAELGMKAMAQAVHRFSRLVGQMAVPVLLAGQVLEHLTEHATPTRSEVCYLYQALLQGYRGVVLSDETAIGQYPVESCRVAALFHDSQINGENTHGKQ